MQSLYEAKMLYQTSERPFIRSWVLGLFEKSLTLLYTRKTTWLKANQALLPLQAHFSNIDCISAASHPFPSVP